MKEWRTCTFWAFSCAWPRLPYWNSQQPQSVTFLSELFMRWRGVTQGQFTPARQWCTRVEPWWMPCLGQLGMFCLLTCRRYIWWGNMSLSYLQLLRLHLWHGMIKLRPLVSLASTLKGNLFPPISAARNLITANHEPYRKVGEGCLNRNGNLLVEGEQYLLSVQHILKEADPCSRTPPFYIWRTRVTWRMTCLTETESLGHIPCAN